MSSPIPPQPPATPPDPAPAGDKLSTTDKWSIVITLLLFVGLIILAIISANYGWVIGLAASLGGVGGLAHEIAQSGGKILFFERKADGFYLGSLAGMVLGAVAALLAVRGLVAGGINPGTVELVYDSLLAGMTLKGVTEAAGGQAIPAGSASLTPGQAMATAAAVNAIAAGAGKPAALPPALGPLPAALSQVLGPVPDVLPPGI